MAETTEIRITPEEYYAWTIKGNKPQIEHNAITKWMAQNDLSKTDASQDIVIEGSHRPVEVFSSSQSIDHLFNTENSSPTNEVMEY